VSFKDCHNNFISPIAKGYNRSVLRFFLCLKSFNLASTHRQHLIVKRRVSFGLEIAAVLTHLVLNLAAVIKLRIYSFLAVFGQSTWHTLGTHFLHIS
jgi:hypothetical protein